MSQLHRLADKFEESSRILLDLLDHDEIDAVRIELALAEAKKGRRTLTLLVKELAQERDSLQT